MNERIYACTDTQCLTKKEKENSSVKFHIQIFIFQKKGKTPKRPSLEEFPTDLEYLLNQWRLLLTERPLS
jgi:hypothetical protein